MEKVLRNKNELPAPDEEAEPRLLWTSPHGVGMEELAIHLALRTSAERGAAARSQELAAASGHRDAAQAPRTKGELEVPPGVSAVALQAGGGRELAHHTALRTRAELEAADESREGLPVHAAEAAEASGRDAAQARNWERWQQILRALARVRRTRELLDRIR